jgi:hypothetical protein
VAGGDDEFGRIGKIRSAEGAGHAGDAGIDLAVGRTHGEFEDRSVRHSWLHRHLRRGIVRGAEDEVAIGVCGSVDSVGQFFGGDKAGSVGITGGPRGARWRRGRWLSRRGADAWGNAGVAGAIRQSAAMSSNEAAVQKGRSMGNPLGVSGMLIDARWKALD